MQAARRRRTLIATAVSALAHVVAVSIAAVQSPMLRLPPETSGPPEPIIPILILPRTPPPGSSAHPAPIRLHRRPQHTLPPDLPMAPLPAPVSAPAAAASSAPAPVAIHPAPEPEGPKGDVKAALRHGPVGCANERAVGLNRSEYDLCDERLGRAAKDAEFIPPGVGMSPAKRALLDQAVTAKEAHKAYMEREIAPGMTKPEAADYDGEVYTSGAGASAVGPITHSPSKRAAKKLGRLPP